MMRGMLMAAVAALALAACSPANSGAPMPKQQAPQNALNAPTQLNGGSAEHNVSISTEQDQQLHQLLTNYLNNYTTNAGQGMSPAPGFTDQIAAIQPGHDYRWQVNLVGGTQYRVLGACDNECSNVDIELIDATGAVVASDRAPDDRPVVNFTPASNGQYNVRLILQTCTIGPCYVGARVLVPGSAGSVSKNKS